MGGQLACDGCAVCEVPLSDPLADPVSITEAAVLLDGSEWLLSRGGRRKGSKPYVTVLLWWC